MSNMRQRSSRNRQCMLAMLLTNMESRCLSRLPSPLCPAFSHQAIYCIMAGINVRWLFVHVYPLLLTYHSQIGSYSALLWEHILWYLIRARFLIYSFMTRVLKKSWTTIMQTDGYAPSLSWWLERLCFNIYYYKWLIIRKQQGVDIYSLYQWHRCRYVYVQVCVINRAIKH
jgi:hypothetical protein